MAVAVTDRIEKHVLLRAPLARVWRALTDSREFGRWFGVAWNGPFIAGAPLHGVIAPTEADPDVAGLQQPHAGKPFDITVDRIEPQHRFSFRWHPYAVEPGIDYSKEPTTLIEFTIEEKPDGVPRFRSVMRVPVSVDCHSYVVSMGNGPSAVRITSRLSGVYSTT